jgi:4-amino-4-deoxychorismate lyase
MAEDLPPRVVALLGHGVTDPDLPLLHVDDLGFSRGDGCFEGLRIRTDEQGHSVVDKLDAHLARMNHSATALGIEFDADAWRELVAQASQAWRRPGEAGLRLFLTRGRTLAGPPTGVLSIEAIPAAYAAQRRNGVRVVTLNRGTAADAYADSPWLLGGVKTISYAVNMAAIREAVRRGADDAILISTDGFVLEAPTGTVMWTRGHTLLTTPLGPTGTLGGTTQQLLFERAAAAGWSTEIAPLRATELAAVESLWLISSLRGPVDVVLLDGCIREPRAAVTSELQQLAGF